MPSTEGPRRICEHRLLPSRWNAAFTLIEVMLVIGILGIVLAMGIPPMVRTLQKEPIRQAATDIVEGLRQARALAVLHGVPADFVMEAVPDEVGRIEALLYVPVPEAPRAELAAAMEAVAGRAGDDVPQQETPPAGTRVFQAVLDPDVNISLLYVNLVDQMGRETATHVRFFPNGTADDFAIVIEHPRGARKIQLDPITGHPDLEVIR